MEELETIDTTIAEELERTTSELEMLERRLAKLEELRQSVSQEVYERVHADYLGRRADLEREIAPLREQAETQHEAISETLASLEATAHKLNLEREEIELRNELGEYSEEDFKTRIGEIQEKLESTEAGLAAAKRLRDLFAMALRRETADGEETVPAEATTPLQLEGEEDVPEEEPASQEEPVAPVPDEQDEVPPPPTVVSPASDTPPDASTVLIRWPKLVGQAADGSTVEYPVTGSETTLGRDPDNDIALSGKKISKHHAVIALVEDGYEIRDLGSTAGTLVNGVQISSWRLSNGDSVQLGDVVLVFMEG
ncbi:MAG TPA: FHA domain-containing protein [Acidobacteria bacterium]|nr:FHA domain-containing protein [Acidobacteriota bacterium]